MLPADDEPVDIILSGVRKPFLASCWLSSYEYVPGGAFDSMVRRIRTSAGVSFLSAASNSFEPGAPKKIQNYCYTTTSKLTFCNLILPGTPTGFAG